MTIKSGEAEDLTTRSGYQSEKDLEHKPRRDEWKARLPVNTVDKATS